MASSKGKPVNTPPADAKEVYDQAGKLFEENKFDEAIALYTQAIEKYPDYSSAYFNRALSYALQSEYEKATNDAMKVMELEPNAPDAPYVMGVISEYQQDMDGAKEWYEKSLKNNPEYAQAKDRLKMLKEKMKGAQPGLKAKGEEVTQTVVEEGQIKKVAWFTSDITFKDIVGMEKQKQLIHDNIILAITKPQLLQAYGKKLGLGVIFYGPPGNGKCLDKDAEVLLPDGRVMRIEEVVERKEPFILTLTAKHKLAVRKVSGWWKLKGKPLLKIVTKRGRVVRCTPEHPFLVKEGWKEAEKLAVGERIGVPRHVPIFGNSAMRECEVKLLAYFIAEGGLTGGDPVFTNSDPEMIEDFRSATVQFDSALHINTRVDMRVTDGSLVTLQAAGRYLTSKGPQTRSSMQKFLDMHGLSFTSSYDKKVPGAVFTLQKRLVALFLNRLFSGDGWFAEQLVPGDRYGTKRQREIGYSSNSETLIRQIQHLLLRFGILSSIFKHGKGFQLLIQRNRDIDTFVDEIGMFGAKAALLVKKKVSWSKIKKRGGNRVVYEEIKTIEKVDAPDYVYDLTVDDTHNFVANDFFVHNTLLVRAIAGETKAKFIVMHINEIVDMYAGNTEKNLHAVFEQARKNAPCIVFADEIDALGTKREGEQQGNMRMAVNQFLQELDGVEKNPEGIFIIGATNQPWDMDPALKRPGRFGESVYMPAPKYKDRREAFRYNTRKMPLSKFVSFGRLARATWGFSMADIFSICDKAALKVAAEEDRTGKKRPIGMKDLMAMVKEGGSSLDEWYAMVKKEVISKTETTIVEGKKQETIKEGRPTPEEKQRYKPMIKDIKKNLNPVNIFVKKLMRFWAVYLF